MLPRWLSGKESACQCRRGRRRGFSPWVGRIPWRRRWHPTPVFLPGQFHGQRSPMGHSPWGHKEPDTAEHAQALTHMVSDGRWVIDNDQHFQRVSTLCQELALHQLIEAFQQPFDADAPQVPRTGLLFFLAVFTRYPCSWILHLQ